MSCRRQKHRFRRETKRAPDEKDQGGIVDSFYDHCRMRGELRSGNEVALEAFKSSCLLRARYNRATSGWKPARFHPGSFVSRETSFVAHVASDTPGKRGTQQTRAWTLVFYANARLRRREKVFTVSSLSFRLYVQRRSDIARTSIQPASGVIQRRGTTPARARIQTVARRNVRLLESCRGI